MLTLTKNEIKGSIPAPTWNQAVKEKQCLVACFYQHRNTLRAKKVFVGQSIVEKQEFLNGSQVWILLEEQRASNGNLYLRGIIEPKKIKGLTSGSVLYQATLEKTSDKAMEGYDPKVDLIAEETLTLF